MGKKKAQHLYEILAQKPEQAQPVPVPAPVPAERKTPATEPGEVPPARKRVEIEQPPVPAPVPVGRGQERVLENVVQLRRDTLIVGVLLIIVAIVVAFFIGRATAPASATNARDDVWGGMDKGLQEGKQYEPGKNEAPEPDVGKQEETAEEAAEEPSEAEQQPAAQPLVEEWEVRLSSLPVSQGDAKESLEKAKDYLVKKGYAGAEVVMKGNHWALRVCGYATLEKAQAAQRELAEFEYQGRRDFATCKVMRVKR